MRRDGAQDFFQQGTDEGDRDARMRDLPPHQNHQAESEQHEAERGQAVLDADDFVVGGENVFLPETGFVMRMFAVPVMGVGLAMRRKLLNEFFHVI